VDKVLLTVPEAAEALGLGQAKTWQLVHSGRLRSVKIDWSRRVPVEAVREFIEQLAAEQGTGEPARAAS
jgi:excisionase family DNA binding protein